MLISRNRQKIINAIVYFAANTQNCGKVKLFKLLYLLDFAHFRETGRSVTGLDYHAWKMGPVPFDLMQEWDNLEAPLNDGWLYYGPTAKELRNCRPGQQKVVAKPARACSAEEKILGFCK